MNMKMKVLVGTFAAIGVVSSATMLTQTAFGQAGAARTGWQRPTKPTATITPIQALKAATDKTKGGTAFQANFEFDEGKWVYGVLVVKGHKAPRSSSTLCPARYWQPKPSLPKMKSWNFATSSRRLSKPAANF